MEKPLKGPTATAWDSAVEPAKRFITDPSIINTVVEIGVDWGYSLFFFSTHLPKAKVIGIDNFSYHDAVDAKAWVDWKIYEKYSGNTELWVMDSVDAAKEYEKFGAVPIDILHIDADHMYESIKQDFEVWEPLVKSGGLVLMHDIESFPDDVGRFFANDLPTGEKRAARVGAGLGAWYKP